MKERTASFYVGDDQWHCTNYPIENIYEFETESGTLIPKAYRAWMAAGEGNLPDNAHFTDDAFVQSGDAIFVSRAEPARELREFRLFETGPAGPTETTINLDDPIKRRGLLMEILECIETRLPMYQEVRTTVRRKDEHYWRLLLPVVDDEGVIASIYIVHRPIKGDAHQRVEFATMLS